MHCQTRSFFVPAPPLSTFLPFLPRIVPTRGGTRGCLGDLRLVRNRGLCGRVPSLQDHHRRNVLLVRGMCAVRVFSLGDYHGSVMTAAAVMVVAVHGVESRVHLWIASPGHCRRRAGLREPAVCAGTESRISHGASLGVMIHMWRQLIMGGQPMTLITLTLGGRSLTSVRGELLFPEGRFVAVAPRRPLLLQASARGGRLAVTLTLGRRFAGAGRHLLLVMRGNSFPEMKQSFSDTRLYFLEGSRSGRQEQRRMREREGREISDILIIDVWLINLRIILFGNFRS